MNGGTGGIVSVLLANGDGAFKTPVNYASEANIAGIAAGDVTGDKSPILSLRTITAEARWLLPGLPSRAALESSPAERRKGLRPAAHTA